MTQNKNPFNLNVILEDSKKFKDVVVLGFDEDKNLHIKTTVNNFPFIHYVLNKALFQVSVIENNLPKEDTSDIEEVIVGWVEWKQPM